MTKKYGLGKGLGALITEEDSTTESAKVTLDINLIKPNREQPRKSFDEERISNLGESISHHGIIQPILVNKEGDFYSIIAGERRWRAAKRVGLKEVPVVIMDITQKEIMEISLIENIQREDLNPIEEAMAYEKLISEYNITQEELSKRVGKSRTTITNSLRLVNLDSRVKEYLIESIISEGHGRALLGIEDKEMQYKCSQKIIDEGLNVRQTEALVREIGKGTKIKSENNKIKKLNPYDEDIKCRLENYFGTKVDFSNKKDKGKIEIQFYSKEDLQRILDMLNIKLNQ